MLPVTESIHRPAYKDELPAAIGPNPVLLRLEFALTIPFIN